MSDINIVEDFVEKFKQEMKEMGHANLIIAGKTGVGKSTLINAAFREDLAKTGIGAPVTDESDVKMYEKPDFPLRIYDTIGLELDEEKRKRSLDDIKKICHDSKKSNDPDRFIHVMWYCVRCEDDRLEPYEADYINEVSKEVPVILVVTKAFRKKHAERVIYSIEKRYPNLNVERKVAVLAQDEDQTDCDEDEIPKKAFGLDVLVESTAQILPEAAQKAWCNAQKASLDLKAKKAQAIVISTAITSFGEGYVPVPFSDAALLVPTQIAMLASITNIFGINVSKSLLKSIVTSLAGTAGATFAGKTIVSNLLKFIPGVGTVLGGTISGTTAAILTVALGEAYIAIMKMIVNGEIKEKDLATKAIQDRLNNLFKERARMNKGKCSIAELKKREEEY